MRVPGFLPDILQASQSEFSVADKRVHTSQWEHKGAYYKCLGGHRSSGKGTKLDLFAIQPVKMSAHQTFLVDTPGICPRDNRQSLSQVPKIWYSCLEEPVP